MSAHVTRTDGGISVEWKQWTLDFANDGIALREQGRSIAHFPYSAIDALFDIASGSDVYASDVQFTVLVLPRQVLVIPIECSTLLALFPAPLRIRLEQQPFISAYSIVVAPQRWRARRWNPFAPPSIRLMLDDRALLSRYQHDWLLRRAPRTLAQYTDPATIAADAENYRRRFWK